VKKELKHIQRITCLDVGLDSYLEVGEVLPINGLKKE